MKILLGKNVIDKPFYWEVEKEKNPHLIVLGTSGSGKTETLKSIIYELNKNKVPSLIIDFHNEFSNLATNLLNLREVSINPLEVAENERPENIVYEVADIIKKIFKLGEIQESILRQAIRQSYLDKGIDLKNKGASDEFPNFSDIEKNIYRLEDSHNKSSVASLISRIEALFDIDIFKADTNIEFSDILKETTVVELKDFPTEMVKSAIAEFFLNKLFYYLYSLNKSKKLRMYCIIDEAHRLMYENSPLDRLFRESRKYGVGVILASQRPSDFNETILANVGGILSFQCSLEKDAKFIGKQLNLETRKIKNLVEPGLGYIKFSRTEKAEKIKIVPLNERMPDLKKNNSPQKIIKKVEDKKPAANEKVEDMNIKEQEKETDIKEKNGEEDRNEEESSEEKKKKQFRLSSGLKKIFFYEEEEEINKKTLLRIFFISLFLLFGIWSLYNPSFYTLLFFLLALIWTPFFPEYVKVKNKNLKLFNVFRFVLSFILIILFLILIQF